MFQFATAGGGFEKPHYIPFKTYDELKNYDKFTDEERAKLVNTEKLKFTV